MIKTSRFQSFIHRTILPRGISYISDISLEKGWEKRMINTDQKSISILSKQNMDQPSLGVVILSHPYLSDAKQFFLKNPHTQVYLENGFIVYLFDFNGFGESRFTDFNYVQDLDIVVKQGQALHPNLPLYLHGVSFGASNVINYSTTPNNLVSKIIVENCLDSNLNYYRLRNKKLFYSMKFIMKLFPHVNKHHDYTLSIKNLKNIEQVLLFTTPKTN